MDVDIAELNIYNSSFMPLVSIEDIPQLSGEKGDENLTMTEISKYLDVSITVEYKENATDLYYKFPFRLCQTRDFE